MAFGNVCRRPYQYLTGLDMYDTILTFTELNRVFIAKKLTLLGRLWYLIRHAVAGGPGWMSIEEAVTIAMQFLSRRRALDLIADGEGLFWDCAEGNLYMHGAWRVARDLGLTHMGYTMPIPVSVFTQRKRGLKRFRAYLFGTWFVCNKPRMLSRNTICKLFNITLSVYNDWRRMAEKTLKVLSVRGNITRLDAETAIALGKDKERHTWTEWIGGKLYICWQIPNAFKTRVQRGADIVAQNVNRRLTRALSDNKGQRERHCRVFYDNANKAVMHRRRCNEHDVFVHQGKHRGRDDLHIWDCYAVAA